MIDRLRDIRVIQLGEIGTGVQRVAVKDDRLDGAEVSGRDVIDLDDDARGRLLDPPRLDHRQDIIVGDDDKRREAVGEARTVNHDVVAHDVLSDGLERVRHAPCRVLCGGGLLLGDRRLDRIRGNVGNGRDALDVQVAALIHHHHRVGDVCGHQV